ncbi:MAG: L-serine ammonia-lyase [Rhodospirillales bacterium]|nr:L-serine ammonia-lyase [Rhodospirillales bacterium]
MISVFDLFKIGLGPSSSHTVGPMIAAGAFREALLAAGLADRTARLETTLYGSLAWTGRGHATDMATTLGLMGAAPDTLDPDRADVLWAGARGGEPIRLGDARIPFDAARDIILDTTTRPPQHPNTLAFRALDADGGAIFAQRWLSIGGGFVLREGGTAGPAATAASVPYRFANSLDLLQAGARSGRTIAEMTFANECAWRPAEEVGAYLTRVREAMFACLDRGLGRSGELPGGLKVKRRAAGIFAQLQAERGSNARTEHAVMDFLSVYAMAVNEENAAGGRVVTAPTNGAAGVMPAVLRYYRDHVRDASAEGIDVFLLTATAIGALFKMNASISGAEVGCQGEVGVASSMAAAGLCAALGGSNEQIENAAEIAMEHHLGMTCDPIGGLVQIPCIERNAFGAVKAVNAASLALRGDGSHRVSLDSVIATMRETGRDMSHKYKETSLGGLAVNWVEC